MKGQIVSIDAVMSLSLLAAMLAVWGYMYQDASPLFQIYTYRGTYLAANHIANVLLFAQGPWRCETPQGVYVPGCLKKAGSISASDFGLPELNMNCSLSCTPAQHFSTPCSSSLPSSARVPVVVRRIQLCEGNWQSCTVLDCNLGVWHR